MEVIKHGKKYDPHKVICKKCDCVFKYEDRDIKTGANDNPFSHNCQIDIHKWVECPECGYFTYIK